MMSDEDVQELEAQTLDSGLSCLQELVDEVVQDESSRLYCGACFNAITSLKAKAEIRGHFLHECINPQGFQYQIGCFHQSLGCDISGQPSLEYSWFEGFHWQLCAGNQCQQHLGWYFSRYDRHFFGLIMRRLTRRNA